MSVRIPSLSALRAFDSVAHFQSCTKAAEHLCVTSAAVSQQIRFLEDLLGIQLFHRVNRSFLLTEAGERLWPGIKSGLRSFENALRQVEDVASRRKLTLSVAPSFAMKWLLPRLKSFTAQHNGIDIWITTDPSPVYPGDGGVDISIFYGTAEQGRHAEWLFPMRTIVVCTDDVFQRAPIHTPEDLRHHTLIHETPHMNDPGCPSWEAWLKAAGIENTDWEGGLRFASPALVVDAAVSGLGVALARDIFATNEIDKGTLRALFVDESRQDTGYWLSHVLESSKQTDIKKFSTWLKQEIVSSQEA